MEKEQVLKILNELTKHMRPLKIDLVEYSYLEKEHEIECFSHISSIDEIVIQVKRKLDNYCIDLFNASSEVKCFLMTVEFISWNEMMMNELDPTHEFCEKYIKDSKMCWGLSKYDDVEDVKITLVVSR